MEFEVDKVYKFRNPGTTKTTDRTVTRIEGDTVFWTVPGRRAEFLTPISTFQKDFEADGVKED